MKRPDQSRGVIHKLLNSGSRPSKDRWQRVFGGGDPFFTHAGASGEMLIARIRVMLVLVVLCIPGYNYFRNPTAPEHLAGMMVGAWALALALVVLILVRKQVLGAWIGLASSMMDVTLVSAALATFLFLDMPHLSLHNFVVFEAYFLALIATCLRYDVKLCVIAGSLAILEYAGILLVADARFNLHAASFGAGRLGLFDWGIQLGRLLMLAAATGLAAVVVDKSRALRRLSTIDRLTGVLNRGSFDERLNAELSRARRQGESLAIVMMDVDHFKKFNDDLGHAAGDAALRSVTRVITGEIRRSDILARYGGEEFVLIMPSTSCEQAIRKVEAIREKLARHNIPLPRTDGLTARLTMSAGVSLFPEDGVTADELVDGADERLFEAKNMGRNRVVGPVPRTRLRTA